MARLAVFTVVSNNYLAEATAWLDSVRSVHEGAVCKVVIVDDPALARARLGADTVIDVKDVLGGAFGDMALRFDTLELNTAVKPFAARLLLSTDAFDKVVYVDPDIQFFSPMDSLLSPLDCGASAILTPHILEPYRDGAKPSDFDFLRSGVFNLGFIALRRCDEALNFLDWWADRLALRCFADPANGMFTDQKWCDLAPAFLPNLHISHEHGANVAYWNLAQRGLKFDGGQWRTDDGSPLIFFHFSGFDIRNPNILSRHEDRFTSGVPDEITPLFEDYARRLKLAGWNENKALGYAFGRHGDIELRLPVRRLFAHLFPDALSADAVHNLDLRGLCRGPAPQYRRFPFLDISRLAAEILKLHPEVHSRFAVDTPLGRFRFKRWLKRHAIPSYGLDPDLVV